MSVILNKDIAAYISEQANDFNRQFQRLFDEFIVSRQYAAEILEVMRYSFFSSAKRIRPLILRESGSYFKASQDDLNLLSLAVEMIHTYSLIHDDLPAMDDDDMRRGKPSSHIRFGEDMAILGGDALLTEAYGLLTHLKYAEQLPSMLETLTQGAGIQGMISGQVEDLQAERRDMINIEELQALHKKKTGALIVSSLQLGILSALASNRDSLERDAEELLSRAEEYGYSIGLLFQITDDILDFTGMSSELGKPVGSDLELGKKTYVTLFGLERAKSLALQERNRATELANQIFAKSDFFRYLPDFLLQRKK